MRTIFFLFLFYWPLVSFGQSADSKEFVFHSAFTAFPDTNRIAGHTYQGVVYPFTEHYQDSSVYVLVPTHFKSALPVNMVFWFHGWFNTIDSSISTFELKRQFLASGKNAILVIPEGAVKAPDSYGGKLEQEAVFQKLVNDVLQELAHRGMVSREAGLGNIVLAGHSGAFRVMAHILHHGGVPVQELFLFDGLYGQVKFYDNWINGGFGRHFVHLYTSSGGGTEDVSKDWMKELQQRDIAFEFVEEDAVTNQQLLHSPICFIHSRRGHNEIIRQPDWFLRLLINSQILQ